MTKQTQVQSTEEAPARSALKLALEALTHGCPPDCKDGMTDSGGVHPWGEPALIPCPNCEAITAIREALAEQPAQQQKPVKACVTGKCPCKSECNSAQHCLYTSPPASKPLTNEMVVAAARMLSDRQAAACNVDCGDMWKMHGNDFIEDARAALEAAHGIKENT